MPRKLQSAATTSSGTGAVLQQSITSSQPMNAGVHRCAAVAWQHAVRRLQDGCWSRLGVRQLCHSAAAGPQNARTTAAAAAPSTALMFPGQGTQRVGMAADLVEQFPCAKHVMEEVDYALGEHLSRLMTHGPQEALTRTTNAQPAIFAHSMCILQVLKAEGLLQDAHDGSLAPRQLMLGHSVGHFTALAAANVLSITDAVRTLRIRGEAMERCVEEWGSEVQEPMWMAALMPCTPSAIQPVLDRVRAGGGGDSTKLPWVVAIANVNSPKQLVISGTPAAVAQVSEQAKSERIARRVTPLHVSAPFHCDLLAGAASELSDFLPSLQWTTDALDVGAVVLLSNVTAKALGTSGGANELIADAVQQTTSTVRWADCVQTAHECGATTALELGCGKVLAGLLKQCQPDISSWSIGTVDDVRGYRKHCEAEQS